MSTTTGNVKISQLGNLGVIDNGAKVIIPVSKDKSNTSTPDWESYSTSVDNVSNYLEKSLGLSDVGTTQGLRTKIANLQDQTTQYEELEKKLGKYNAVTKQALTTDSSYANKYIAEDGTITSYTGCSISNPVDLKQGNIYLLKVDGLENLPNSIAFFSKVHKHEYHVVTGTHTETHIDSDGNEVTVIVEDFGTQIDTVYEPVSSHYHSTSAGGYGVPSSGYLVYFADEDESVVVSNRTTSMTEGMDVVKYGVFIEIAEEFLSINGEMMKVLVEAIAKHDCEIKSLFEKTKSLGDLHVTSIDSDNYPTVQGEPMVIVKDAAPSAASADRTKPADVPNRIGQIWVNTTDRSVYIATKLGGVDGWTKINN